MNKNIITQQELKLKLSYNKDNGTFLNIKKSNIVGSNSKQGYLIAKVNGKNYYLHRLAWLYIYGYFPKNCIDHINGNKSDNRLSNLREATLSQNNCNQNISSKNTSGIKGVCWDKNNNKWKVSLAINGKSKHIGLYKDLEIAKKAMIESRLKYHGEFSNNGTC
jgi:hypothetical protein